MQYFKLNKIWDLLLFVAIVFISLYIYYTIFPGNVTSDVYKYFPHYNVTRAENYHRINRLLFISSFIIDFVFLFWYVFSGISIKITQLCTKISYGNYTLSIITFFLFTWILLKIIALPFSLYAHIIQLNLGFSIQSWASWWNDYFKSAIIDVVITCIGMILFLYSINLFHKLWWIYATAFLIIMLFLQNLIWPTFIAPMFNKFTPIKDPSIINMVNDISRNASIKISKIEEMDASKRTTLANAYFYGLGNNSKIVLYDTLLKNYPKDEIKAVIAHEAAHWKENHVLKSLLIGSIGIFILLFIFNIILKLTLTNQIYTKISPAVISLLLLYSVLINFDISPIQNYISRQMERQADILSVQYIHDKNTVIKLQVNLAKKSLSDVEPPAFIEWFSYSHPSAINRIRYVENYDLKK